MGMRMFAEFESDHDFKMFYDDMLNRIPKKYHFDFIVFMGRVESTYLDKIDKLKKGAE